MQSWTYYSLKYLWKNDLKIEVSKYVKGIVGTLWTTNSHPYKWLNYYMHVYIHSKLVSIIFFEYGNYYI